jgi:hypothetical protein
VSAKNEADVKAILPEPRRVQNTIPYRLTVIRHETKFESFGKRRAQLTDAEANSAGSSLS